jgi:hypothetical protein
MSLFQFSRVPIGLPPILSEPANRVGGGLGVIRPEHEKIVESTTPMTPHKHVGDRAQGANFPETLAVQLADQCARNMKATMTTEAPNSAANRKRFVNE